MTIQATPDEIAALIERLQGRLVRNADPDPDPDLFDIGDSGHGNRAHVSDFAGAAASVLSDGVQDRAGRINGFHLFNARHPNLLLHNVGAGRFRPPLTVAREFRLCLRPGGTLRVQSLHLPQVRGLGSA